MVERALGGMFWHKGPLQPREREVSDFRIQVLSVQQDCVCGNGLQFVLHQALLLALCAGAPRSVSRAGSERAAEEEERPEEHVLMIIDFM